MAPEVIQNSDGYNEKVLVDTPARILVHNMLACVFAGIRVDILLP